MLWWFDLLRLVNFSCLRGGRGGGGGVGGGEGEGGGGGSGGFCEVGVRDSRVVC